MKKFTRVHPVVETLESLMLLSTTRLHEIARPAALVSVEATSVILHGTISGTGTQTGTMLSIHGSGNLGEVGVVSLKASGNLLDPPSSITLSTRKGKLVLENTSAPTVSGTSGSVTYAVAGGTRAYANAIGSGLGGGTYAVHPHDKVTFTIHFS